MKAWKSFYFEAAHSLPDNPEIHGHSYKATAWQRAAVIADRVEAHNSAPVLWCGGLF